jgi:uncharacterized protein
MPIKEYLYHLVKEEHFINTSSDNKYLPPTYEIDGFIHLTKDPSLLLEVANHFYKSTIGPWVCLRLDPSRLTSPVVYEAAAPVGEIQAVQKNDTVFPHLYGYLNLDAIVESLSTERAEDGTFLSINSL